MNADKSKLFAQVDVDKKQNISAGIFFKEDTGSLQSVFGSDRKYWSEEMKNALDVLGVAGFPNQLLPMGFKHEENIQQGNKNVCDS